MTQQKAASLTSSLFARKGRASPADLVIADRPGAAPNGEAHASNSNDSGSNGSNGGGHHGTGLPANLNGPGIKLPVLDLNGAASRRLAPEPELPLLAFVEAQIAAESGATAPGEDSAPGPESGPESAAEDEPVPVEASAEVGEEEAAESSVSAEASATPANIPITEEPRPAASLLDRGARALKQANGHAAIAPARPPKPAETVPEMPVPQADEAEEAPTEIAAETVSGDDNVTAIEDAPHDEAGQQLAAEEPAPEDTSTQETAGQEETGQEEAAQGAADRRAAEDAPATADEPAASDQGAGSASAQPATPASPAQAETPSVGAKADADRPAASAPAAGRPDEAASVALRRAVVQRPPAAASAAKPGAVAASAAVAAPLPPAPRRELPWRSVAVVLVGAAIGLGGYLAISGNPNPGESPAPIVSAMPPAGAPDSEAPAPTAKTPTAKAPEATAPETKVPNAKAAGETAAVPAQVAPTAPEPSFDIIRIEPDGQSIIAGRAQPFSEWILLNNGEPIASIKADANGEWVVLPDASLVPGANSFSLVPKAEHGKVAIPAPAPAAAGASKPAPEAAAPAAPAPKAAPQGDGGADAVPGDSSQAEPETDGRPLDIALPKPRPDGAAQRAARVIRVSPGGSYQVQLASVRQSADAERERVRLAGVFPKLLGALDLQVQQASVEGAGTFFRVRSGAIADLGDAREVCRRLSAAGQGCLVVRRPAVAEAPQSKAVEEAQSTLSPAQQEAERP